ncbi:hypothetical protein KA005_23635 [bacterium]|nr:hypothetical protein [bacterium]
MSGRVLNKASLGESVDSHELFNRMLQALLKEVKGEALTEQDEQLIALHKALFVDTPTEKQLISLGDQLQKDLQRDPYLSRSSQPDGGVSSSPILYGGGGGSGGDPICCIGLIVVIVIIAIIVYFVFFH